MKQSPTKRSLEVLRKSCDLVEVTERWCQFSKRRKDLFGIIDIVAIAGNETIAVQTTSWANVSARAKKVTDSPAIVFLRQAGWKILIHGWRKNTNSGRYELKTLDLS